MRQSFVGLHNDNEKIRCRKNNFTAFYDSVSREKREMRESTNQKLKTYSSFLLCAIIKCSQFPFSPEDAFVLTYFNLDR